tara:strand:- start:2894 stop:3178 length:285 start_codon:yes stop_codon:yes gene_type:complete
MIFLIGIMSFANFVFYPLVIGTLVAVVIEQILRAKGDDDNPKDVKNVFVAMGVRKYLWRQSWLFNIIWFVSYFILMLTVGRQGQQPMPDMIWQG